MSKCRRARSARWGRDTPCGRRVRLVAAVSEHRAVSPATRLTSTTAARGDGAARARSRATHRSSPNSATTVPPNLRRREDPRKVHQRGARVGDDLTAGIVQRDDVIGEQRRTAPQEFCRQARLAAAGPRHQCDEPVVGGHGAGVQQFEAAQQAHRPQARCPKARAARLGRLPPRRHSAASRGRRTGETAPGGHRRTARSPSRLSSMANAGAVVCLEVAQVAWRVEQRREFGRCRGVQGHRVRVIRPGRPAAFPGG